MNNNSTNTLEFIQLIKCIIEYYGTTKTEKVDSENSEVKEIENSIEKQLSDAEKVLGTSFNDFNLDGMSIIIPSDLDASIKKTFLSNLEKFQ